MAAAARADIMFFVIISFRSTLKALEIIRQQGDIQFANLAKTEHHVLYKTDSLLSRMTTTYEEECWLKCLENQQCLSVNVIVNQSYQHCELFSWTGYNFGAFLVSKTNSYYMQLKQPPFLCTANPCANGGSCQVSTAGQYVCSCTKGFTGINCQTNCTMFDFESGSLDGWTRTGTAFNNQPTYGDNPTARGRGQPSNHRGSWWIGGYENRPSSSHPAGQTQGDGPTGTMTSPAFTIRGSKIKFLIDGGSDINNERIELMIGGSVVAKETGNNAETMTEKAFDVTSYRGQTAQIRIVDTSSGSWGHINVDHIEDIFCTE